MFKNFWKIEYKPMSGKVERICVAPCNDTALTYLIKLQNNPQVFEVTVVRGSKHINMVAFTKENDNVSFEYYNKNYVNAESFKNTTFSV